jgi:hypothetical protein
MRTPPSVLPEITFLAAVVVPPMVFPVRSARELHALVVRHGGVRVGREPDPVALHGVSGGAGAGEKNPGRVCRNHVAAADRVPVCTAPNRDAGAVAQWRHTVHVDSDEIALDGVPSRRRAVDEDAVAVEPEEVAGERYGATDRVLARAARDCHTVGALEDLVARDDVAGGPGSADRDTDGGVLAYDIAGAGGRPADRVALRAVGDRDSGSGVGRSVPHRVRADSIAGNDVAVRPAARDPDSVGRVPWIVFRAPAFVPPTVFCVAPAWIRTPIRAAADGVGSPIALPSTKFFVVPASVISTPAPRLLPMRFPALLAVPPIVFPVAPPKSSTTGTPPVMLLPATTLVFEPSIATAASVESSRTMLRAPALGPPTVLSEAPAVILMPAPPLANASSSAPSGPK